MDDGGWGRWPERDVLTSNDGGSRPAMSLLLQWVVVAGLSAAASGWRWLIWGAGRSRDARPPRDRLDGLKRRFVLTLVSVNPSKCAIHTVDAPTQPPLRRLVLGDPLGSEGRA